MNFASRLNTILSVYNINASELAEKMDIQRSSISHILSGRNNPSLDFMIKIKNVFPDLSWDWLLKDEGPMYATGQENIPEENIDDSIPEGTTKVVTTAPSLFDETNHPLEVENKNDLNTYNQNSNSTEVQKRERKIKKIVWFYNDGTMEVFNEA